ncbi:replication endonuclease [Undibacterium curvum]|uniref:Replication endonuclease n=1 Tax=Undibacterium curvum TaxID=2762294 RepID=A0ABR7A106_9BURK|nr:replication endonuclease [Undibacterium curvum]MBC3930372.1 replication endonuclease [Undibacterium curvum]
MQDIGFIPGIPRRFSAEMVRVWNHCEPRKRDAVYTAQRQADAGRIPLDAGDAAIYQCADEMVKRVYAYAAKYQSNTLIVDGIAMLCRQLGIAAPQGNAYPEMVARALDRGWWIRGLRKEHARRFENVAIQLGFVSYKAGVYLSNESAVRQMKRNAENAALLAKTQVQNENGQIYTLEELSKTSVSNNANRRGEMMTRIRGMEEIAKELSHVGMFWTITCPSKFHGSLAKSGESNPKYQNLSPREAQDYLCKVWQRIRAKFKRCGIAPYGFRIAEPHHDGCPHWHMLLFVAPEQAQAMEQIIRDYALREDGTEAGAAENRVKLVKIEAGKGSAAGYIAKYVAKNIDGAHVGDHKTADGWIVAPDMLGNQEITPSQRVTLWSQVHGIRQFQQIGGAPVSVWRELRRIKYDAVLQAPAAVKQAWSAAQRNGESLACFADYIRAQGGATVGRGYAVKIARRDTEVTGKYATYTEPKPCGVYCVSQPDAVYESIRYQWTVLKKGGVAFDLPRTGVNNCTQSGGPDVQEFIEKVSERAKGVRSGAIKIQCHSQTIEEFVRDWKNRK